MSAQPSDDDRTAAPEPGTGAELVAVETTPGQIGPPAGAGRATYADVTAEAGQRKPIVPDPWRRQNVGATLRHHAGSNAWAAWWQVTRSPAYALKTLWYGLRGALALLGRLVCWWHAVDLRKLESLAVAQGRAGHNDAMKAHTQGLKTRASRGRQIAVCLVLAIAAVAIVVAFAPWWVLPLAGLLSLPVLARYGRPPGKKIVQTAIVPSKYEIPTPEIITSALGSLGISLIDKAIKEGRGLNFLADVHRDGPGWATMLDLPRGVAATEVIEKREKLASGLRSPFSSTWPSPGGEHPGRLHLWIGFESFADARPIPWPLKRTGTADLFKPIPFGADYRGNAVSITLMFASMLIAAMPRMGKTFALRIIALAAALDPTARLRVWELKGTGDLKATRHVAHEYGSGADDETIENCLASVRDLYKELERRAKVISELPEELARESKVTPQLAARRDLRLYPEVMIIDEAQEAYSHKEMHAEFEWLTVRICKRGPALGIMLVIATQRPDKESLPKPISANMGIRFCLKVMGPYENNAVLGAGMYAKGIRATDFSLDDKGIGYLAGDANGERIVRTCYIDAVQADAIGRRARALREAAGTLSGYALGHGDETAERSFLADVLSVFGSDSNLWTETIAARLAERIPEAYPDITKTAVADQLRNLNVEVKQVRQAGDGVRAGCERASVESAAGAVGADA